MACRRKLLSNFSIIPVALPCFYDLRSSDSTEFLVGRTRCFVVASLTRPALIIRALASCLERRFERPWTQSLLLSLVCQCRSRHLRRVRNRPILHPVTQLVEHLDRLTSLPSKAVLESRDWEQTIEVVGIRVLPGDGFVVLNGALRWDRLVRLQLPRC